LLGVAFTVIKGSGAPEVEAAYARARVLCQRLVTTPQLFPVLYGLLLFYTMCGQLKTALEVDQQLQSLTQQHPDPIARVQAYLASGMLLLVQGKFAAAQTSLALRDLP
jgi:predicted ATPase